MLPRYHWDLIWIKNLTNSFYDYAVAAFTVVFYIVNNLKFLLLLLFKISVKVVRVEVLCIWSLCFLIYSHMLKTSLYVFYKFGKSNSPFLLICDLFKKWRKQTGVICNHFILWWILAICNNHLYQSCVKFSAKEIFRFFGKISMVFWDIKLERFAKIMIS